MEEHKLLLEIREKNNWDTLSLEEKCKLYHEITYGFQDKILDSKEMLQQYLANIKLTGNKIPISFTGKIEEYQNTKNYFRINLNKHERDQNKKYAISNVRVKANKDIIFDLEIGGQRVGRVGHHSYWKDENGFYVFNVLENTILPIFDINHHATCIAFFNDDPSLEVSYTFDFVEIEPFTQEKAIDFEYTDRHFREIEHVKGGEEKNVKLYFNHPAKGFDVLSTKKLDILRFCYNDKNELPIDIPFLKEKDDLFVYHIDFDPTINFSQIDSPKMIVQSKEDAEVYIFVNLLQGIRGMSGMYGLSLSK